MSVLNARSNALSFQILDYCIHPSSKFREALCKSLLITLLSVCFIHSENILSLGRGLVSAEIETLSADNHCRKKSGREETLELRNRVASQKGIDVLVFHRAVMVDR